MRGHPCLIIDDLISTGGTIVESAHALRRAGGDPRYVAATHTLLLDSACERMAASGVTELFVTDTISNAAERCSAEGVQAHIVSMALPIAAAIRLQFVERGPTTRERVRTPITAFRKRTVT